MDQSQENPGGKTLSSDLSHPALGAGGHHSGSPDQAPFVTRISITDAATEKLQAMKVWAKDHPFTVEMLRERQLRLRRTNPEHFMPEEHYVTLDGGCEICLTYEVQRDPKNELAYLWHVSFRQKGKN